MGLDRLVGGNRTGRRRPCARRHPSASAMGPATRWRRCGVRSTKYILIVPGARTMHRGAAVPLCRGAPVPRVRLEKLALKPMALQTVWRRRRVSPPRLRIVSERLQLTQVIGSPVPGRGRLSDGGGARLKKVRHCCGVWGFRLLFGVQPRRGSQRPAPQPPRWPVGTASIALPALPQNEHDLRHLMGIVHHCRSGCD